MSEEPRAADLARRAEDTPASLSQLTPDKVEALVAMLGRAVTLLETLPRLEASIDAQAARLEQLSSRLDRIEQEAANRDVVTQLSAAALREEVRFVGTQAVPGTMAVLLGEMASLREAVQTLGQNAPETPVAAPAPEQASPPELPAGPAREKHAVAHRNEAPIEPEPPQETASLAPTEAIAEVTPVIEEDFEGIVWADDEVQPSEKAAETTWPDIDNNDDFDERLARLKAQKAEERQRWEAEQQVRSRRGWLARLFGR